MYRKIMGSRALAGNLPTNKAVCHTTIQADSIYLATWPIKRTCPPYVILLQKTAQGFVVAVDGDLCNRVV